MPPPSIGESALRFSQSLRRGIMAPIEAQMQVLDLEKADVREERATSRFEMETDERMAAMEERETRMTAFEEEREYTLGQREKREAQTKAFKLKYPEAGALVEMGVDPGAALRQTGVRFKYPDNYFEILNQQSAFDYSISNLMKPLEAGLAEAKDPKEVFRIRKQIADLDKFKAAGDRFMEGFTIRTQKGVESSKAMTEMNKDLGAMEEGERNATMISVVNTAKGENKEMASMIAMLEDPKNTGGIALSGAAENNIQMYLTANALAGDLDEAQFQDLTSRVGLEELEDAATDETFPPDHPYRIAATAKYLQSATYKDIYPNGNEKLKALSELDVGTIAFTEEPSESILGKATRRSAFEELAGRDVFKERGVEGVKEARKTINEGRAKLKSLVSRKAKRKKAPLLRLAEGSEAHSAKFANKIRDEMIAAKEFLDSKGLWKTGMDLFGEEKILSGKKGKATKQKPKTKSKRLKGAQWSSVGASLRPSE